MQKEFLKHYIKWQGGEGVWHGIGSGYQKDERDIRTRIQCRSMFFYKILEWKQKDLEYSQYMSKESLAQQGGYTLALKGPQA